jgi:hypothetical protein
MIRRAFLVLATLAALAHAAPLLAQGPSASAAKPFVIYVSPASRKFLEPDSYDLKSRVNRWRDYLIERGLPYKIVTHPSELASIPMGGPLILPSAVVLPEAEQRVIAERLAGGDSLLATWMPASLDASGAPVAATFIEKTFGVAAKVQPFADRGFLVTVGDTPLTHMLPAGTRAWVGKDQRYRTPLLAAPGAGYLSDWSRTPGESGLIAATTVGKSRRVLLGWPENVWDAKSSEHAALAAAAIDWITGKPVAYARSWPAPHKGALTVGIDALWRFENVPHVAELAARHGVHASFHFLPADARANEALIRGLAQSGQSVGGFGDATQPFAGQPEAEQRARVERMVQGFREALGPDFEVKGLRAPQGATDAATEKAAAILDYLVDAGRVDSAVPVASQGRMVLLSASANLDATSTPEAIAAGLAGARTRTRVLGGYAFVGVDAAALMADSAIDTAVARFIEANAAAGANAPWSASAAEVAEWWRARSQVKVATTWAPGESAMTIDVSAAEALRYPLAIALVPPAGFRGVRLEDTAGASLQNDADGNPSIVLTALPAGTKRMRVALLP